MSLRNFIPVVLIVAGMAPSALAARERPARPANAQGEVKLERGSRVDVNNPNGSIKITGGETLRIVATYADSGNTASVSVDGDNPGGTVEIRPSFKDDEGSGEVRLELQLPKVVTLNSVVSGSGDVEVSGMQGDVRLTAHSGNVRVANVGSVVIRAGSGDVLVEGVAGNANVEASSGNITAHGVKGDLVFKAGSGDARVENVGGLVDGTLQSGTFSGKGVTGAMRVVAISGDIRVDGSGPAQVQSASGNIVLSSVNGDCDAKTASGNVVFSGEISAEHSYRLKSLSGEAVMRLCGKVPGFTASLRSYSGEIETEFELKVERSAIVTRELVGRYLDGRTQIQIEAFSGSAKILKCGAAVSE